MDRNRKTLKKFFIITSNKEDYFDAAKLIKRESTKYHFPTKIVKLDPSKKWTLPNQTTETKVVVFLLTNDKKIIKDVVRLRRRFGNLEIINLSYLKSFTTKKETQERLSKGGIITPKIFALDRALGLKNKFKYPIFIKSNFHCTAVLIINNKQSLTNFLQSKLLTNNSDWYVEENLRSQENILEDIYFVNGEIFGTKRTRASEQLNKAAKKISTLLEIDVFSAGFFVKSNSNQYWCFDINPAPAMFRSIFARQALVKFTNKLLVDNFDNPSNHITH